MLASDIQTLGKREKKTSLNKASPGYVDDLTLTLIDP